jgi:hypothetical protein
MRLPTILACACLAAGAALPASAAALGVPQRNAQTLAAQLVDLTVPSDMIIADAEKAYEANFRTGFLANPRARDAVQRMPGLLDAATNAGVTRLDKVLSALMPRLKADIAASYAKGMTANELEKATSFYAGPVGRKLVAATPRMAAGARLDTILTRAELSRFAAFSHSAAGRKVAALMPGQTRTMMQTVSRALRAAEPQIDADAMAAGKAYMQTHR